MRTKMRGGGPTEHSRSSVASYMPPYICGSSGEEWKTTNWSIFQQESRQSTCWIHARRPNSAVSWFWRGSGQLSSSSKATPPHLDLLHSESQLTLLSGTQQMCDFNRFYVSQGLNVWYLFQLIVSCYSDFSSWVKNNAVKVCIYNNSLGELPFDFSWHKLLLSLWMLVWKAAAGTAPRHHLNKVKKVCWQSHTGKIWKHFCTLCQIISILF